jgi:hypothetical protein
MTNEIMAVGDCEMVWDLATMLVGGEASPADDTRIVQGHLGVEYNNFIRCHYVHLRAVQRTRDRMNDMCVFALDDDDQILGTTKMVYAMYGQ